ncbi:MAG: preprotein translocase subunit SecE [Chloroflexia bacterium]|nr:preprotein translocase subunit SecE [Chloroflexia bacterium]
MATQRKAQSSKRQGKANSRSGASRQATKAAARQAVVNPPVNGVATGATAGTLPAASPAVKVVPRAQARPGDGGGGPGPAGPTGRAAAKDRPAPSAPSAATAWRARTEGLRRLVADTRAEVRRVNWPDQETTRALTIVVIAISAALGILLGGIDFVLFELFEAL